ncbi:MAG: hypothetical protein ACQCN5_11495 [Candidatus Bathyarchaeia archaeon]|jgi:hypothetical protein
MTETPFSDILSAPKKEDKIEEIMQAFQIIGEDIQQIGELTQEETTLAKKFFETLQKSMTPLTPSIAVTASALPYGFSGATKAIVYSNGLLALTYNDDNMEIIDLTQPKNRDLMVSVFTDVMPKLINFKPQPKQPKQIAAQEITKPAPIKPKHIEAQPSIPAVTAQTPIDLPKPAPSPAETPAPEHVETPPELNSIYSAEQVARIEAIKNETLEFIELLSNEKFEFSPISRFFDDWMVNLRQVVTSFASNGIIEPDEEFNKQFSDIFNDIEEELAKRLMNEAELEVSTKTLEENKQLLGEMNAGYAAQTKDIVTKGTSAIEFLIKNVRHLEEELADLDKVKTSYLHPLKKMAQDQKRAEINQKLTAAKKRLALTVQSSTIGHGTVGDLDAEYATQAKELAARRKLAISFLVKEVRSLEKELNNLLIEADSRNPIKRLTRENKIIDVNLKLDAARKRLRIAEQDSGAEQKKLHEEYLKKKQAMVGKMQTLEKDIKTKEVDNSMDARKAACNSLADAVKALIERKLAPPEKTEEEKIPENAEEKSTGSSTQ